MHVCMICVSLFFSLYMKYFISVGSNTVYVYDTDVNIILCSSNVNIV